MGPQWISEKVLGVVYLLSLVFTCRENPRRSGILLFPDCPRFCPGFCRLMKTRNRRYPRSSGVDGDKSGELVVFLFSRRVPDFCDGRRSFPTNENSNLYRRGRRRWISLITNPLDCWAPVPYHASFNFWRTFHFRPNSSRKSERELWRLSDISGTVGKKWKPRSSGIFPTYENQALALKH